MSKSKEISISLFQRNIGADLNRNPEIRNNIKRPAFLTDLINKQKEGSTIVQFGDGSGRKLMICAGIHGNEEESNIATMRYLRDLRNFVLKNGIEGTIYIIPFAIPQTTAINSRNFMWQGKSVDPNRVTNIPGTPGFNILEFCGKYGITHMLDIHSGGGLERARNGLIIATRNRRGETDWAKHIRRQTRCEIKLGGRHAGMMRGGSHRHGMQTLTLEAERDQGCTSEWSRIIYRMIQAGVDYLYPDL